MKITYNGVSFTKKIKIMPLILKTAVSKKKLTVKVTISKKAKNKPVKVKINSKTYLLKTNKMGVAKVIVKKPKTITAIKATYLKQTVKII